MATATVKVDVSAVKVNPTLLAAGAGAGLVIALVLRPARAKRPPTAMAGPTAAEFAAAADYRQGSTMVVPPTPPARTGERVGTLRLVHRGGTIPHRWSA